MSASPPSSPEGLATPSSRPRFRRPGGLRRRLTTAFVLVAGLSAGALAIGSFLLVRQARLGDSLGRAEQQARIGLKLAGDANLGGEGFDDQGFAANYQTNQGIPVVLVVNGRQIPSSAALNPRPPVDLQAIVRRGELGFERLDIGGVPYLVVGGRARRSGAELYLLFSEQRLQRDLRELGTVLLAGWLAVVAGATVVGRTLARRTLEPVAQAGQAARSIARGLMATRLESEYPLGAAVPGEDLLLATRLPVGEDEFGRWAASFNEMADALQAKITALSQAEARERRFTSDVSHELRTPLSALVGEASLLRDRLDELPPDTRRVAELLIRDVARLRRLVDDLMEIARLDSAREGLRIEQVDVGALVDALTRSRGWARTVVARADGVSVTTDRRRLERILANLIGNAVEHGGGSPVRVAAGADREWVFVSIADDGPGVDAADLPHLFDRFYKADRSRSVGGSGLGLAIAMENARLLGGDIQVRSEPGRGARFTVLLPVHHAVTEQLPRGEAAVAGPAEHEAHRPSEGGIG